MIQNMSLNYRFPVRASRLGRLSALSALLLLAACKGQGGAGADAPGDTPAAQDAVPVEVAHAVRRTIAASYSNTAALEAREQASVTARASGVVTRVFVDVGQPVTAGQVLIQLDTDSARLSLLQAEAQMRKLENNHARAQQLVAQQMLSARDADEIKFNLDNARAQYDMAKLQLAYATIKAPISGVIATRNAQAKPGNLIQVGVDVVSIVDVSVLEATLNVPEREIATLKPGQAVDLVVDALPGQHFTGKVDRIAPVVDAGSGTFRVISRFDSQGQLQPGMFGRLGINYDQRADALVVPRNALLEDGGEPAVYVVRDGKAVRTNLVLGYSEGGWVEVRDGLEAGDAVVIAGKAALREGSTVQVLGEDKATPVAAKADDTQATK